MAKVNIDDPQQLRKCARDIREYCTEVRRVQVEIAGCTDDLSTKWQDENFDKLVAVWDALSTELDRVYDTFMNPEGMGENWPDKLDSMAREAERY